MKKLYFILLLIIFFLTAIWLAWSYFKYIQTSQSTGQTIRYDFPEVIKD